MINCFCIILDLLSDAEQVLLQADRIFTVNERPFRIQLKRVNSAQVRVGLTPNQVFLFLCACVSVHVCARVCVHIV